MFKFLVSVAAGYAGARAIEAKVQKVPVLLTLKYPFTSVAKIKAVREALPRPPAPAAAAPPTTPAVSSTAGAFGDQNQRIVAAWWAQQQQRRQQEQQQQAARSAPAARPRLVRRGAAPWRFPNAPMRGY